MPQPTKDFALDAETRDVLRRNLIAAMSEWSEENYCAGWLIGLEGRLHREGGDWERVGRLIGWPIPAEWGSGEAEGTRWETWDEASVRYAQ